MELSSIGNSYLQENEPWAIMKTNPQRASNVLFLIVCLVRFLGSLAEPYMSSFSAS
jgi:methionyl-tRNA synthetase